MDESKQLELVKSEETAGAKKKAKLGLSRPVQFDFSGHAVRTRRDEANNPWFHGADICTALGYQNSRDAISRHVDEEDKNTIAIRDGIVAGNPNHTFVNESGMYALIFGSHLPNAKAFKRWVTNDVLPSLRKQGYYERAPKPRKLRSRKTEMLATRLSKETVDLVDTIAENFGMSRAVILEHALESFCDNYPAFVARKIAELRTQGAPVLA